MKPPCTERYARWCERTGVNHSLLLDFVHFPAFRTPFCGEQDNFIHLPAVHAEKPLISVYFYRPKCVDRRYLFRWRSASFFRRTCTAQSGQYLARLELGVKAAPQTVQRLISSRPLVISAHRAASSGRTATLNHWHSSE